MTPSILEIDGNENKFIHLALWHQNEMVLIEIKNTYLKITTVTSDSKKILSNKPEHQGIGLKNIEESVKHYKGSIDYTIEENYFISRIIILNSITK